MCEVETTLVLKQHNSAIHPSPEVETDKDPESRDLILLSRKRRAKIVAKMETHKALAHSA